LFQHRHTLTAHHPSELRLITELKFIMIHLNFGFSRSEEYIKLQSYTAEKRQVLNILVNNQ
jgi:hypothetical protein